MDLCVTCNNEVWNADKAMECSICERWEHITCVKRRDRPDDELYEAMVRCPTSRSILYVCSPCRKMGSIAKRFVCNDLELSRVKSDLSRATDERLASARQIESQANEIERLRAELSRVITDNRALTERVQELNKQPSVSKIEPDRSVSSLSTSEESALSSDDDSVSQRSATESGGHSMLKQSHPPGFKEVRSRVKCFTGKRGEDDFQWWVEDYEEVSKDYRWSDQDQARWFSWFVSGPAKLTWQRTLKESDKTSWPKIVEIYKGQYGVHLDPRTAYQRCHELTYEQFGSAQGLLEAMRDYQRLALTKLTNETLESILWNKAPIELQKEVREIPDGSVQELLQRLLRAEQVVAERKRRSQSSGATTKIRTRSAVSPAREPSRDDEGVTRKARSSWQVYGPPEATLKNVKCFKCHRKGHIAAKCPKLLSSGQSIRRITTAEEDEAEEMWVRVGVVTTDKEKVVDEVRNVNITGPTYKVDVTVEGLKTRALIDNGSQVSLVCTEMLPRLREINNWTMEECKKKTHPMVSQPVGAGGQVLGARKIVVLSVMTDASGKSISVPCYVLDSGKPLWQGTLRNCGLVLGTNAITALGMKVLHSNGEVVQPDSGTCEEPVQEMHLSEEPTETSPDHSEMPESAEGMNGEDSQPNHKSTERLEQATRVILSQVVHLGPRQTKDVKVEVQQPAGMSLDAEMLGIVVPDEDNLAERTCDFVDTLWRGEPNLTVKLNNWGLESMTLAKGHEIGFVEAADMVGSEDPVWNDTQDMVAVRVCQNQTEPSERRNALRHELQISDRCTTEERQQLEELLLELNEAFALNDSELGETDLITHNIDTGRARPVQTAPRRLPYALRKELEEEMTSLLATGCIEPSASPYASALVLVRKKGGGLRVCVDYRGVNKDTIVDKYPIPRIDKLIDMVGRNKPKIFTSLDLMRGYHQVKMDEDSKHKTAFVCHMGLFQFRRMPFGLTNAPATFQRLMSQLFAGKEWEFVSVYLDDLLIASKSMTEHMVHVKKVLSRLKDVGLRLKPSKCMFATEEIEYLGHTLTPEGVKPNSKKVEAVRNFPIPKNVKEVKSFLGLANFYRRHIPDMATISRTLTALTRKNMEFKWTAECEVTFKEIKKRLVSAPVLRPPDLDRPFILWTDASERGFGAVLEQESEDGQRHPIAYASRATNGAERKYAPTELEVAALVFALEHFRVYLLGNQVKAYTDHQALVSAFIPYLKSQTKGILARWYLRLSQYLPNAHLSTSQGEVMWLQMHFLERQ